MIRFASCCVCNPDVIYEKKKHDLLGLVGEILGEDGRFVDTLVEPAQLCEVFDVVTLCRVAALLQALECHVELAHQLVLTIR